MSSDSSDLLLAVNCGSSSIKFKLFEQPDLNVLISGSASNVAVKGARALIKYTVHAGQLEEEREEEEEGMAYDEVFERIINHLESSSPEHQGRHAISIVAHRVVHGGTQSDPMLIYKGHEEGLELLDKLSEFAPLHNHRSVTTVRSCLEHLPKSTQVLCFDTLFHASLPPHIYTYPLEPPKEEPPIPLRKYGAHGLSYASILRDTADFLGKPQEQCNLVVAHLGSGASVCMIRHGKSADTTMGLSPLEGLPGGTRSGSVDPILIFHHTASASEMVEQGGGVVSKAELVLNKQAGLQALAGTSDFGKIVSRLDATPRDEPAELAYALFVDRVLNFVGAYMLKLIGAGESVDGVVFSGGIGEKGARLRADVGKYLSAFGGQVDKARNESKDEDEGNVKRISSDASKIGIFVCKTDEEAQCARMARDWMNEHGRDDS
ncbi:acetate and butyrate kinase [Exidia glandulosa HHB12029]|uniref:Probable acetate kinase n=1 Tax=Exidia glandulosa HHB12029 TaxID=1314781 RepID=A0A165JH73_EXIGL|nr:acetate and butyrate kinase [Exidia glandulosa HHB12029]